MNTNQLKRFAQEARIKLINQISAKLELVLTTDSAELREKAGQIKTLQEAINATSKDQVIDKVAYTWFNRFMALRFMDVNGYQPIGIQVVSPKVGYTLPELLDEAKQGHIPKELNVRRQHIYDLLDGKIPSSNAQNEAYKELLIGACNHLHTVFPFLFERINDYTELLLPEDLTSEFSILQDVRDGMSAEDCEEVEIIGWLYQFYISEKKDEVFASKKKVEKEDIPAATQLFTPRWIVEYMVQNTVGKLWLQNRSNSRLREHMPYFIESPSVTSEDYLKVNSPEEITLLDQACGSGHILVYGFELLSKIYEEEGYNPSEIPQLIIEKNLYGFEIDERAAQLAGLALMLKARSYQRRVFRKAIEPNILCYQDLKLSEEEIKVAFKTLNVKLTEELLEDLTHLQQATNLGSLIIPQTFEEEIKDLLTKVKAQETTTSDIFFKDQLRKLKTSLETLKHLANKYHCVVDNPPYMGSGNMNKPLSDFVRKYYPDSKADLMACFMEAGLEMLQPTGFLGMINQHSWMFLSSYENLRKKLIKQTFFDTLLHLGPRTFPEIGGEVVQNVAFTFWNLEIEDKGRYIRLIDFENADLKRTKTLEAIRNVDCDWFYVTDQKSFENIPGSPLGYWVNEKMAKLFDNATINESSPPRAGLTTGSNERYLRYWMEISKNKYNEKWINHPKGGSFRKWFGNNDYVLNWENDGREVKSQSNSVIRNSKYYFSRGLSWSDVGGSLPSFRIQDDQTIANARGPMIYSCDELLHGFLNSKIVIELLEVLNPTLVINVGNIGNLPFKEIESKKIEQAVKSSIEISRHEWNSREDSLDFTQNGLRQHKTNDLEGNFKLFKQYWQNKFYQLHKNEEELNKEFIDIYGLNDELTPDVALEDITILKDELNQKQLKELSTNFSSGWKLVEGKWQLEDEAYAKPELPFDAKEVFAQFLSYAVGCMFGRYSLDKEGLILANQGETLEDYLRLVNGGRMDGEWNKNGNYDKGLQGTENLAAEYEAGDASISTNEVNAQGRVVQSDQSNKTSRSEHTEQYSRGASEGDKRVSPLSQDSPRVAFGVGDTTSNKRESQNVTRKGNSASFDRNNKFEKTNSQSFSQTPIKENQPSTNDLFPVTFMPDDDNIIPILDDEWFEDDIVGRFYEFLKVSFGVENFDKNLAFVEECLGKDIRRYFVRDFYADHIKRYKKRPIYWMFSSPKNSFNVLIYMHRYTPDTLNQILNNYLVEYREKLKVRNEHLDHIIETGTATEQTKAAKEKDKLKIVLLELQEYERDTLYPLATERIPIDLDDGVLVNYNKFGKAIKEVSGVNDKKAKKKVMGFDWIDVKEIR